jgi:hypothetical protein
MIKLEYKNNKRDRRGYDGVDPQSGNGSGVLAPGLS